MVVAPAGKVMMGSPWWEVFRWPFEGPVHEVAIARPFAVGVYEVTFEEWDACVCGGGCGGYRPDDAGMGRGRRPVIHVSWEDAQGYVEWLSRKTGKGYRLLSESEWEYVARAGTETEYFWWGGDYGEPGFGLHRANLETCVELSMHGSGEGAQAHARWERSPMQDSRWFTNEDGLRFERWRNERVWYVGWEEAQAYVRWLSGRTGERYRLLNVSEWDAAERAGTGTGYFWWGDCVGEANYSPDAALFTKGGGTTPVGSYPANPFGLYDVHGNVWEWVEDGWNDGYHGAPSDGSVWTRGGSGDRVMRGGSWCCDAPDLRSASRFPASPDRRRHDVGLRVARAIDPAPRAARCAAARRRGERLVVREPGLYTAP